MTLRPKIAVYMNPGKVNHRYSLFRIATILYKSIYFVNMLMFTQANLKFQPHPTSTVLRKNTDIGFKKWKLEEKRGTWRAQKPSFSGVLIWDTMLSSTQSTVIGILAPHLSQSALIPHFTAMSPVRLEFGVITLGFGSIIRVWIAAASELRDRSGDGDESTAKRCRRETRPLERASMAEL